MSDPWVVTLDASDPTAERQWEAARAAWAEHRRAEQAREWQARQAKWRAEQEARPDVVRVGDDLYRYDDLGQLRVWLGRRWGFTRGLPAGLRARMFGGRVAHVLGECRVRGVAHAAGDVPLCRCAHRQSEGRELHELGEVSDAS